MGMGLIKVASDADADTDHASPAPPDVDTPPKFEACRPAARRAVPCPPLLVPNMPRATPGASWP